MSDSRQQSGKDDANDERAQRLAALSNLSQGREQADNAPPFASGAEEHAGRGGRRRVLVGVSLLLVVVMAASVAGYLATRARPHRPAPLVKAPLNPVADGLNCDRDIAWSPNGSRIAVLGYKYDFQAQGQCPEDSPSSYLYEPGLIHIYDGATKRLAFALHPDDIISAALHLPTVDTATPMAGTRLSSPEPKVINYSHALWSPDGAQLAVTFFTDLPGPTGAWDSAVEGVLLVHPDGSGAHVLSHAAAPGAPSFWVEWNLATGAPVSLPGVKDSHIGQSPFPAALGYSWTGGSALTAQTVLQPGAPAIAAPPLSPIGNPAGDSSFTAWQPMQLDVTTYIDPSSHQNRVIPGVYSTRADYVAWSPDSQYLALMGYVGLLEPNGTPNLTVAETQALDPSQYPILPVRDKALAAALGMVSQDPNHAIAVSIAWKPDGRQLAVTSVNLDPDGAVVPASYRVLVFDCATGTKLATLTPDVTSETVNDNNGTYLRWSPDGKRLLLADGGLGTMTVWSGSALP